MKILFCLGSMTKGGAERVVANLSNWLIKEHQVGIVVTPLDPSHYSLDSKIKYMTLDGLQTNKKNKIRRNLERISKLNKYIKDFKPDIILTFLPEPSYRVLFLKPLIKTKVITSIRNDPKVEYKNFIDRIIMKILYKRSDGFVFQTKEAQEYFSSKIQQNSVIIPNPINPLFIVKPYGGKREKNIVTVGRLEEQKNHKLLINSFNIIKEKYKDYNILIYGSGSLEDELKSYVKKLKLENRVIFKGESDNIKDEIYKSKMFVLSSDYEGMPNSLMEAMSLGLPCISTDCPCGGSRFLISNNKNGILVPVNDQLALSHAIEKIIDDENFAKSIGDNASKIGEELEPLKINQRWLDYIMYIKNK